MLRSNERRRPVAAVVLVFVAALAVGCETVPRVGDVPSASRTLTLTTVQDQRPAAARTSHVEKSGVRPILLLGDERFEVPPIVLLDRKLAAQRPDLRGCAVIQLDVRYRQGGSPDDLTTASTFAFAGMISPVLGAMAYGAATGMARDATPSEVQVISEVNCGGTTKQLTQSERLASTQESRALAEVLERAVEQIALNLSSH